MATTVADLVAAGSAAKVFVDTNVFVYSTVPSSPFHIEALDALQSLGAAGVERWASQQILREYLATMTRLKAPFPAIFNNIRNFRQSYRIAQDSAGVFDELLTLLSTIPCGGKQVHDANIVATMLVHGVPNLLTHNTADFQRFSHLITVIPLVP
jgi:predicted nucleic acid-binding protein